MPSCRVLASPPCTQAAAAKPSYGSTVTVMSESQRLQSKLERKAARRAGRGGAGAGGAAAGGPGDEDADWIRWVGWTHARV